MINGIPYKPREDLLVEFLYLWDTVTEEGVLK